MADRKKQRPLIRYAGSAAETSIGSKPIGSELSPKANVEWPVCQASWALPQSRPSSPRTEADKASVTLALRRAILTYPVKTKKCDPATSRVATDSAVDPELLVSALHLAPN